MSFPELKITGSLRFADPISASLGPNGKRLMVLQGKGDQRRLLFYDATDLRPLQ